MQTIYIEDKTKHLPPKLLNAVGIGWGAWIAGGAARCLFLGSPINDIDVWYTDVGKWSEASNRVSAMRVSSPYVTDNATTINVSMSWDRDKGTFTDIFDAGTSIIDKLKVALNSQAIEQKISEYKVQLIRKKFYPTLESVFDDFDFSVCKVATDGQGTFTFADGALEDIINNRLRCTHYAPDGFLTRFIKYNIYGYSMPREEVEYYLNQPDMDWKVKDDSATY